MPQDLSYCGLGPSDVGIRQFIETDARNSALT